MCLPKVPFEEHCEVVIHVAACLHLTGTLGNHDWQRQSILANADRQIRGVSASRDAQQTAKCSQSDRFRESRGKMVTALFSAVKK